MKAPWVVVSTVLVLVSGWALAVSVTPDQSPADTPSPRP
jgi:hypothetical protein